MVDTIKHEIALPGMEQLLDGNAIILKATQAKQLFEAFLPKFSGRKEDLAMFLHKHCAEPYVVWEDSRENECIWENLTYSGKNLWNSGLCEDLQGNRKGTPMNFTGHDACKGGCGHWAGNNGLCSLCDATHSAVSARGFRRPQNLLEARRMFREDVSNLRKGSEAKRASGDDRKCALEKMIRPDFGVASQEDTRLRSLR